MSWNYEIILNKNMLNGEREELLSKISNFENVKVEEKEIGGQYIIKITTLNFHKIKESILTNIAYFLVKLYKQKYFQTALKHLPLPATHISALSRALTLFDIESDIFYTLNILPTEGKLITDSFFGFKMTKLKDKWNEFVNVTNLNSPYLANKEIYIEFLKFLYSVIEPQCEEVNVFYNINSIELMDDKNHKLSENIDVNDEISLITNLIILAPNTINLHCIDCISSKTFKTLYYIFNKKINLLV